jgi:hypothetical protein
MLNLPKSWGDITIDQFVEINRILTSKSNISNDEFYFEVISLISNLPVDELEQMDYDEFQTYIKDLNYLTLTPPPFQPKTKINTEAGELYFFNQFTKLTNGEFIDLEYLIMSENYIENIKMILAVLFKRQFKPRDLLSDVQWEPYNGNLAIRANLFGNQKVVDVFGALSEFIQYREDFYKKYEGFFGTSEPEELEDIEGEGIISRATKAKEVEKQNSYKKWGWNLLMYNLCGNDPLRFEESYKLPLILTMNILSMRKELNIT